MSKHRLTRLSSLLLALVLTLSALPLQAAAKQSEPLTAEVTEGYVEQTVAGASARDMLNKPEQLLYDYLKEQISLVADGKVTSSVFSVDKATFDAWNAAGFKCSWTKEEMGVDSLTAEMVYEAFFEQFDMTKVMDALLHDCPYALYWFDTETGVSYTYASSGIKQGQTCIQLGMCTLDFQLRVSADYQNGNNTTVSTTKIAAAKKAAANAQEIVDRYASASDYDKLLGYRDEICKLVSYDKNAAVYGDSWQLVNVFDGNSATNVVCEGYAKAFQYLCDLSDFDNTTCYSVHGKVNNNNHMWNIVTMDDGKNYLVDLTNSDTGTAGADGSLFLAGGSGSVTGGYAMPGSLRYRYNGRTMNLWGIGSQSILKLADGIYHHWVYTLNGDTITAACDIPDCANPNGGSVRFGEVPEILIADGSAKTIELVNSLTTGVETEVVYDCADGCKTPGSHTASLTVGGHTISVDFVIEEAPKATALVNVATDGSQVTFGVRSPKVEDAVLVISYYKDGKMVSSQMSETTTANANYAYDALNADWDLCQIFLLKQGTMAPMCASGRIVK